MTTDVNSSTATQAVLPLARASGPGHTDLDERETFFRFPAADDPNPGTPRLLAMSLYAVLLGLAGVGVGARGLVSTISGGMPGWYVPVLAFAGMLSVALSVGAYLSIHRSALPWLLLLAAAAPLTGAVMLAVAY